MSGRARNPRVVAREKMMEAKRWLGWMTSMWGSTSKVYVAPTERKPGENASLRDRRPDEYPENSPEDLRQLIEYMQAVQVRCREVEELARQRLRKVLIDARGADG